MWWIISTIAIIFIIAIAKLFYDIKNAPEILVCPECMLPTECEICGSKMGCPAWGEEYKCPKCDQSISEVFDEVAKEIEKDKYYE